LPEITDFGAYRPLPLRRLGPLCPTGIVAPEKEEVATTLGDWLDEIKRVQLMLRLTPRLAKNTRISDEVRNAPFERVNATQIRR
jgi:hypothetical protein